MRKSFWRLEESTERREFEAENGFWRKLMDSFSITDVCKVGLQPEVSSKKHVSTGNINLSVLNGKVTVEATKVDVVSDEEN